MVFAFEHEIYLYGYNALHASTLYLSVCEHWDLFWAKTLLYEKKRSVLLVCSVVTAIVMASGWRSK